MNNKWNTHTHTANEWTALCWSFQFPANDSPINFFQQFFGFSALIRRRRRHRSSWGGGGGTHAAHLVVSFISRQVAIARRAKSKMASSKQSNQASGHHQTAARYTGTNKEKNKKKKFWNWIFFPQFVDCSPGALTWRCCLSFFFYAESSDFEEFVFSFFFSWFIAPIIWF